jgi:hypothetical protein
MESREQEYALLSGTSELHVCWSRVSRAMKNDPISSEKLDIMEELLLSRANNGR